MNDKQLLQATFKRLIRNRKTIRIRTTLTPDMIIDSFTAFMGEVRRRYTAKYKQPMSTVFRVQVTGVDKEKQYDLTLQLQLWVDADTADYLNEAIGMLKEVAHDEREI